MKTRWIAAAAVAALVGVPCLAQTDSGTGSSTDSSMSGTTSTGTTTVTQDTTTGTTTTTSTDTTTGTGGTYSTSTGMSGSVGSGAMMDTAGTMTAGMTYTNVDSARVRGDLDKLRGYLTRMQENNRLANASGDIVQADGYRRTNEVLLDNASGLALGILDEMGPAAAIPPGMGEARDHMDLVASHLGHARMMADYSVPINDAKNHLDMVYQALDRGASAMTGSNMSGAGMMGGMSGSMNMNGGTMGNMGTMGNNTTDATKNQSNPALNNYNSQNNAGTGMGATTSTPNTTPGQPGTGN